MALLVCSLVLLAVAFLGAALLVARPHLPDDLRAAYRRQLALQPRSQTRVEALLARQVLRWRGHLLEELLPRWSSPR